MQHGELLRRDLLQQRIMFAIECFGLFWSECRTNGATRAESPPPRRSREGNHLVEHEHRVKTEMSLGPRWKDRDITAYIRVAPSWVVLQYEALRCPGNRVSPWKPIHVTRHQYSRMQGGA